MLLLYVAVAEAEEVVGVFVALLSSIPSSSNFFIFLVLYS